MTNRILSDGPRLRRGLILAAIIGTPLVFLRTTADAFNVPKLAFLTVVVAAAAAIRAAELLQTRDARGLRTFAWPAAAIPGALVVSWIFGAYPSWSLLGAYPRLLGLIPYVLTALLGILVADAFRGRVHDVLWAALTAAAVAAAYGILQVIGADPFEWSVKGRAAEGVAASTLGNTNFVGGLMAMGLPAGTALLATDERRRVVASALSATVVAGWIAATSQIGWLAGAAGVAIVGGSILARRHRRAPMWALLIAGSLALLLVASVALAMTGSGSRFVPNTVDRRSEWWEAATSMTLDQPFVGGGPNAFAIDHPRYRTQEDALAVGLDIESDPHNLILSLSSSAGIFGIAAFGVLGVWLVRRVKAVEGTVAAGAGGVAVAYLVQMLGSIDTVALRSVGWAGLGALAAAAASIDKPVKGRPRGGRRRPIEQPIRSLPAVLGVAALGIGLVWWGFSLVRADMKVATAQEALQAGDLEAALSHYEEALELRSDVAYRRAYGVLLGDVAVSAVADGQQDVGQRFLDQARAQFGFLEDVPHVPSMVSWARVLRDYALAGGDTPDEALAVFERAVDLDPHDDVLTTERDASRDRLNQMEQTP